MATNNDTNDLEKATVDEEYLMQVISGEQTALDEQDHVTKQAVQKSKEKAKTNSFKKPNYEETFLTNRFPSGRNIRSTCIHHDHVYGWCQYLYLLTSWRNYCWSSRLEDLFSQQKVWRTWINEIGSKKEASSIYHQQKIHFQVYQGTL